MSALSPTGGAEGRRFWQVVIRTRESRPRKIDVSRASLLEAVLEAVDESARRWFSPGDAAVA